MKQPEDYLHDVTATRYRGRFDDALHIMEEALQQYPDRGDLWIERAFTLGTVGRDKDAIYSFERAAECAYPHKDALAHKQAYLQAAETKAKIQNPDGLADLDIIKATGLSSLGDDEAALKILEDCIRRRDRVNDPKAWFYKALSLLSLGRTEEALDAYDAAVRLGLPGGYVSTELEAAGREIEERGRLDFYGELGRESPVVSYIVRTFNRKDLLPEAIDSLMGQDYSRHDIIVVIDGSTDGTKEMFVQKYKDNIVSLETEGRIGEILQRDGKIRVIAKQNGGVASALNMGLRKSIQGRCYYVSPLDDDDIALPHRTRTLAAHLDANPDVDLVHSQEIVIDSMGNTLPNSNVISVYYAGVRDSKRNSELDAKYLEQINFINTGTTMFRKKVFDSVGFADPRWNPGEDWDYWTRIAQRHKTGFVRVPVMKYRLRQ